MMRMAMYKRRKEDPHPLPPIGKHVAFSAKDVILLDYVPMRKVLDTVLTCSDRIIIDRVRLVDQ